MGRKPKNERYVYEGRKKAAKEKINDEDLDKLLSLTDRLETINQQSQNRFEASVEMKREEAFHKAVERNEYEQRLCSDVLAQPEACNLSFSFMGSSYDLTASQMRELLEVVEVAAHQDGKQEIRYEDYGLVAELLCIWNEDNKPLDDLAREFARLKRMELKMLREAAEKR